jgi:hypothetical protein
MSRSRELMAETTADDIEEETSMSVKQQLQPQIAETILAIDALPRNPRRAGLVLPHSGSGAGARRWPVLSEHEADRRSDIREEWEAVEFLMKRVVWKRADPPSTTTTLRGCFARRALT